jgi:pimeloyl-ACP methyl ester carboxylesterase
MKTILLAALALAGITMAPFARAEDKSGTLPINGLDMYYEIHGEGEPLVLLHGAYMSIDTNWAGLIPTLSRDHKVIAVELQDHGHTSDRDTPITYDGMADDVAALLDQLGVEKAAVFGYSMGGSAAIRLAIRHPDKVTRIVAASGGYIYNEAVMGPDFMKMIGTITPQMFANTPFEAEYKRLNPHPENFPVLVEKLKALDLESFDWSEEFARISVPSLYIYGDADVIPMDYIARHHVAAGGIVNGDMNGLPKTQLLVLPGTSHIGVFFNPANIEIMKLVVPAFLKQQLPAAQQMPS